MELPQIPLPVSHFLKHTSKCASHAELQECVKPFKDYESKLREIFAQQPKHSAVLVNHLVPVFTPDNPSPKIRARNLDSEPPEVKDRYLLPLEDASRRAHGSSAIVKDLSEFKTNFNLFCESSLVDLDWSNVIAAGSSVVTALLPVEAPHNESKRALRAYYHQTLAPASDVDLFIYGLNEEQAIEKIKQIETKIRDSILSETTTIRTKNAITIVSEYPTRHVQIVLRLYKSVSEILTGFDVDCSCVAYDGQQVWASPRALTAFMTQVNTIDLTRRSPSYENRLSKYSHRGFEVHWPALDRSKVDPTIFERSFSRVMGLARLLVLEKLPHPNDRDTYLNKRREERGRPPLPWNARFRHQLPGNIKDAQPDDVAEWVEEDDVSNYHTFTIPYGPKYNARKTEKLLFTKDLLLNAEWNRPKDREVVLHRHPAFFGSVQDVIHDCCGFCPKPETDEDLKALEEEQKIYISGNVEFIKDDPGRQAVGSFHPITDDDWAEMAYVGNTTRLCHAIVNKDLEAVEDWFSSGDPEEILDVNRRDHAGRTPLLLATMAGTPEIVQFLVDHGARLVSRLYNGFTALHIAAYRGEVEMVQIILDKSSANEEDENRKEEARKVARKIAAQEPNGLSSASNQEKSGEGGSDAGSEGLDEDDDDDEVEVDRHSDELTEGSFIKVSDKPKDNTPEDDEDEPDVYDIDVLAWDQPMSPLHLAIVAGNIEVINLLLNKYGADVLLPVKIVGQENSRNPGAAILTLVLALQAPLNRARQTISTLLSNGAITTQADMKERSALHFAIRESKMIIIEAMQSRTDSIALEKAINHVSINLKYYYHKQVEAPLLTAIRTQNSEVVKKVLSMGAKAWIDYESYARAYSRIKNSAATFRPEDMKKEFRKIVQQPIMVAAQMEMTEVVMALLDEGAGVNTLLKGAWDWLEGHNWNNENKSLLDVVRDRIKSLEDSIVEKELTQPEKPEPLAADETYLTFDKGSYQYWTACHDLHQAKIVKRCQMREYDSEMKKPDAQVPDGQKEKTLQTKELISSFKTLEAEILERGGKSFYELYPDAVQPQQNHNNVFHNTNITVDESPYKTHFSFNNVETDSTDKQGYLDLFEAAWLGDIDTVKKLCMNSEKPLQVATEDLSGYSPFSIAVFRGHYQLASVILDIATVQYQPSENVPKYRYRLGKPDNEDSDRSSEDTDSQADDEPPILKELIDDQFTVDDIVALADHVKSKISPLSVLNCTPGIWRMLGSNLDDALKACGLSKDCDSYYVYLYGYNASKMSWPWFHAALPQERVRGKQNLVRYAILKNDMEMLRFLLSSGRDLKARTDDEQLSNVYTIDSNDFNLAIKLGRVEMIGEIIRTSGHAMPLNQLMENSGVNIVEEKPRYYQGLSVHGRKRKDWADRGQGRRAPAEESDESPLLKTIFQGNQQVTEYYLSDGPMNRYQEFADAHRDDKRIQALAKSQGGIDKALHKWLGTRAGLAIHMAVMSEPSKQGHPLLEYLLKVMPDIIETKSCEGLTPLHLAFRLGRMEAARILIAAGADQTTRDDKGDNLLHTIFKEATYLSPTLLPAILGLLDPKLIQTLLLERSGSLDPGSMTPLATYLNQFSSVEDQSFVLRIIFEHSKGSDLELMNGAGDYVLHSAVRAANTRLIKFLVETRPDMLYWENATGLTPMDVAEIAWLGDIIAHPPEFDNSDSATIVTKPVTEFVEKRLAEEDREVHKVMDLDKEDLDHGRGSHWYTHHLVQKLAERYPGKRKLVSLLDANEVAKRLAKQQQKRNEENRRQERMGLYSKGMRNRERYEDYDRTRRRSRRVLRTHNWQAGDALEGEDEVERWLSAASGYPKVDLEALKKAVGADGEGAGEAPGYQAPTGLIWGR